MHKIEIIPRENVILTSYFEPEVMLKYFNNVPKVNHGTIFYF